jgi:hypothetical protein
MTDVTCILSAIEEDAHESTNRMGIEMMNSSVQQSLLATPLMFAWIVAVSATGCSGDPDKADLAAGEASSPAIDVKADDEGESQPKDTPNSPFISPRPPTQ